MRALKERGNPVCCFVVKNLGPYVASLLWMTKKLYERNVAILHELTNDKIWLESQLEKCPEATLKEFCEANKISPRYAHTILFMNNLSPKIKRLIMDGYVPSHLSLQDVTNKKFPTLWKEQEEVFAR